MSRLGDPSTKDIVLRLSRSSFSQHEREVESGSERHKRIPSKATSEGSFFWPIVNVWDRRCASAVNPIAFYYAGVQPLNDTVVSFVALGGVLWALNWVDKKGWDVNYRTVIVVATITTLAMDVGTTMFTIWDLVRSQWFWIGLPVLEAIPSALDYTISTVVLTEVTDPSARSTMSGLVTSVSFLGGPIGLALSKYIDAWFDVTNQDIMTDTTHVRDQIMATFFIAYAMQLASLLWLFALPKHASEAQELKLRSGTSTIHGAGLLMLLGASLPFVVAVHVLSVYEPTACLGFSGGTGC
ncbi:hypothetical protein PC112_g15979 [Phytophthora cactorum]|nr:hypothetical protein PC112_g15979 [Phytophthora cactorum]